MTDIRDLLERAAHLDPRDADPVGAVLARRASAHRRRLVGAGAGALAVALVAVAAAGTGWSPPLGAGPAGSGGAVVVGDVPPTGDPGVRDRYDAFASLEAVPHHRVEEATSTCMAAAGWRYDVPRLDALVRPDIADGYRDPLVDVTPEGYLLRETPAGAETTGTLGLSATQRSAYDAALVDPAAAFIDVPSPVDSSTVGMATGGCRPRAAAQVFGSVEAYLSTTETAGSVRRLADAAARSSPELTALDGEWLACVRDRDALGAWTTISTPEEAVASTLDTAQNSRLALTGAARGPLARADGACREEIGYAERRTAVEDRYLTAIWDEHEEAITAAELVLRRAGS